MSASTYSRNAACSFTSAMPLDRMFAVLRASFAWHWCQRENYQYGDYIWASTDVPTSAVRIIEEDGGYFIDVEFPVGAAHRARGL